MMYAQPFLYKILISPTEEDLNKLGVNGWFLVQIVPDGDQCTVYLRKPITIAMARSIRLHFHWALELYPWTLAGRFARYLRNRKAKQSLSEV